jgi:hypothetical protein
MNKMGKVIILEKTNFIEFSNKLMDSDFNHSLLEKYLH